MSDQTTARFRARMLTEVIDTQGRRRDWLAQQAGISAPQLSHIERGRRTVTEDVALRISTALGAPVTVIFESADADLVNAQVA